MKFSEIKTKIKFLGSKSTNHGIIKIFTASNSIIRLMWVLCTLLSSSFSAFLIFKNIEKFYQYEVNTKILVQPQFKSIFPSVTICNTNFFTSDYIFEFIDPNTNFTTDQPTSIFNDAFLKEHVNNRTNKKLFGDSIEKLIMNCRFLFQSCDKNNFTYYLNLVHGNCYTFNYGLGPNNTLKRPEEIIATTRSSRNQGLRLTLNISVSKKLRYLMPSYGAFIFVHNQTDPPNIYRPVTVAPGFETNIAIRKTLYTKLPKPYSDCDPDTQNMKKYSSRFFQMVHENFHSYKRTICLDYCYQNFIIDRCNCNRGVFKSKFTAKICSSKSELECLLREYNEFTTATYVEENCLKECPLECDSIVFDKIISFYKFSNKMSELIFNNLYNLTDETFSEQIAQVNVYLENLDYKHIYELKSMSFLQCLSNIGGIASLFLGISILSIFEFFEFLFEIINSIFTTFKTNKVDKS